MEKQLKELRNTMDQSIFRDAQFTQKERVAIHAKTQKKKQARWMPRIAFSLSVIVLLLMSAIYIQTEHSANYRITAHDLEDQYFKSQNMAAKFSSFYFYENELVAIPTIHVFAEAKEAANLSESRREVIYPNISVKTNGTIYYVYSDDELIITLEKIAPRIVVDQDGNRYSTGSYLSKEYELQFINNSSVDLFNLELNIGDKSYTVTNSLNKPIQNGGSLALNIPREPYTSHQTISLDVTFIYKDAQGNEQYGEIAQPFILDNSYSDYYTISITGDSYDTLELALQLDE
ncbi:hypothetical protein [Bacillus ndiopicus]|uniref:hypothetical protein n=1 Tax=Bacillus ndiopicus TaxID=1347368 RepID=UPI0005AA5047|nr:hypothetical protein [Bacillus ndiopicus]